MVVAVSLVAKGNGMHLLSTVTAIVFAATSTSSSSIGAASVIPSMMIGGLIGAAIGYSKWRTGLGFLLGMFLGCIGWIIVGLMSKQYKGYKY